jgi:hypothetical protein
MVTDIHAGIDRLDVAADDGLEGLHDLAGDRHRVDAQVRHGAVAALAADRDLNSRVKPSPARG